MSFPKGHPKVGGRAKGTGNRATIARQAAVAASGLTPLDFLLSLMRDEGAELHLRLDAAKAAASFVHPKLASIAHSGKDGGPVALRVEDMTENEIARRIAFVLMKGESRDDALFDGCR